MTCGYLGWSILPTIQPLGIHGGCVSTRCQHSAIPIIQAHVAPETIIHSDEWRAYHQVASLPSVASHGTVNHSVTFVNPTTGVHTHNIESYWERVKLKLKHMKGCHAHQIPSYLDEFMWRERHAPQQRMAFDSIMRDIAQPYPV